MTHHNPGILKLDHVNVRTAQLDQMIDWYSSVLGLRHGDRPEFSFPGAWLYAGDTAVVHLVGTDGAPGAGTEVELKLEHFALTAASCAALENSLLKTNTRYQRVDAIAMGIVQFNVWDPDGNHIHIDCPIDS